MTDRIFVRQVPGGVTASVLCRHGQSHAAAYRDCGLVPAGADLRTTALRAVQRLHAQDYGCTCAARATVVERRREG